MAFLYFINQRQYYGRQGIDMETNCRGMLHLYEQAVKREYGDGRFSSQVGCRD